MQQQIIDTAHQFVDWGGAAGVLAMLAKSALFTIVMAILLVRWLWRPRTEASVQPSPVLRRFIEIFSRPERGSDRPERHIYADSGMLMVNRMTDPLRNTVTAFIRIQEKRSKLLPWRKYVVLESVGVVDHTTTAPDNAYTYSAGEDFPVSEAVMFIAIATEASSIVSARKAGEADAAKEQRRKERLAKGGIVPLA